MRWATKEIVAETLMIFLRLLHIWLVYWGIMILDRALSNPSDINRPLVLLISLFLYQLWI